MVSGVGKEFLLVASFKTFENQTFTEWGELLHCNYPNKNNFFDYLLLNYQLGGVEFRLG